MLKARTLRLQPRQTPWGDSERYDFILDTGPRLWRVQLKCTQVLRARGYDVQPIYSTYGKGKITYTADDITTSSSPTSFRSTPGTSSPSKPSPAPPASASTPASPANAPAGKSTAKPGTSSNNLGVLRTFLSTSLTLLARWLMRVSHPFRALCGRWVAVNPTPTSCTN